MVLNKGIYTLKKRTKDSDEPSSSHSRSSLSEISLTFFDNQPPIGENNLSYVKRRWEIIEEGAKAYAERLKLKTPEKLQSFAQILALFSALKFPAFRLPKRRVSCVRAHQLAQRRLPKNRLKPVGKRNRQTKLNMMMRQMMFLRIFIR